MEFTADHLKQLTAALPGGADRHKECLLRLILAEWGRIDLEGHLSRPQPKQIRTEIQQLEKVARRAIELAEMISDLTPTTRFTIAGWQLEAFAPIRPGSDVYRPKPSVRYAEICDADRRLGEEPARLEQIARATIQTVATWKPLPMRHSTAIRYLILQDLAAIAEHATGEKASRKVRVDPHPDAGHEYGQFWDLASTAWPIIFGSSRGLSHAVQSWAEARAKFVESSPVIANISLRHPEWGIFDR
jgi:hypothetical protein